MSLKYANAAYKPNKIEVLLNCVGNNVAKTEIGEIEIL